MHKNNSDYTNTFCYLMDNLKIENKIFQDISLQIGKKMDHAFSIEW